MIIECIYLKILIDLSIDHNEEEKIGPLQLQKSASLDPRALGSLGQETRADKVSRYLQKKMRRKWNKHINYHSRK